MSDVLLAPWSAEEVEGEEVEVEVEGEGEGEGKQRRRKKGPQEASTKRPVALPKAWAADGKKGKRRAVDPRFNELCGELDRERFRKQYGFVYDEHLQNDASNLAKALKKVKNPDKREALKGALTDVKTAIKDDAGRQKGRDDAAKARALLAGTAGGGGGGGGGGGAKKFHVPKAKQKEAVLKVKFERLKKEGRLDKWLETRRRKVAAKERKRLPKSR